MEDKDSKKRNGRSGLVRNGLKKEISKIFSFLPLGEKEEAKEEISGESAVSELPQDVGPKGTVLVCAVVRCGRLSL